MREITLSDVDDIARGAAVLGAGGGGDQHVGRQLADGLGAGTLGLAQRLGRTVRESPTPVASACGGFVRGEAGIEGIGADRGVRMRLAFQNEHLVAERDGEVVTSTPDLVCVLDNETGEPVTTEGMRYGNRVAVLGVPCDSRWTTPEGLRLTGPRAFGYDHDYLPITGVSLSGGKK
jgi:DUF917 family protein